jgi:hypothetical protein
MLWRHKKRGTTYEIIGEARAQCETPIQDDEFLALYDSDRGFYVCRFPFRADVIGKLMGSARSQCESPIQNGESLVLYCDVESRDFSVRRKTEFQDGRFEVVTKTTKNIRQK